MKRLLFLLFLISRISFGQNVQTDATTYTPQQLIEDILIDSNCIENVVVTNVIGGDFNNTAYSYIYRKVLGEDLKDTFEDAGNGFGRTYDFKFFPMRIDDPRYAFDEVLIYCESHKVLCLVSNPTHARVPKSEYIIDLSNSSNKPFHMVNIEVDYD